MRTRITYESLRIEYRVVRIAAEERNSIISHMDYTIVAIVHDRGKY